MSTSIPSEISREDLAKTKDIVTFIIDVPDCRLRYPARVKIDGIDLRFVCKDERTLREVMKWLPEREYEVQTINLLVNESLSFAYEADYLDDQLGPHRHDPIWFLEWEDLILLKHCFSWHDGYSVETKRELARI